MSLRTDLYKNIILFTIIIFSDSLIYFFKTDKLKFLDKLVVHFLSHFLLKFSIIITNNK